MMTENQPSARTKITRFLITIVVIVAVPITLMGLFFIVIGVSSGTVFGWDFAALKSLEYVGKGILMTIFGVFAGRMAYRQLKNAW